MNEQEKIYQAYRNAIFNLQNCVSVIEHGDKLTRAQKIERLKGALAYFRDAHKKLEEFINK